MSRVTLIDRLRYATDNIFSKGTIVLIGWLAAITAAIVLFTALVIRISGVAPGYGFLQLAWMGLMRTLDSGTMGGDEGSWPFLLAMLAVTLAGIFVLSTLIGILTSGIETRLEALRKGRSRVIESNDKAGSEVYLKPVSDYVDIGIAINFYTLLEAAARRDEIAIGYRRKMPGTDGDYSYAVVVNPNKAVENVFAAGDSVIVFAEE